MLCDFIYVHTQEAERAQWKETPLLNVPKGAERGAELLGRPQQEMFGRDDCEFVEPPPTAFQTKCSICSLILPEPYQSG